MDKILSSNVSDILDTIYRKNFGRNIFLFAMGMLISAMAFNLFFNPYNIIPTGSSGFALLLSELTKLDVALVTFMLCLLLLLVGLLVFGWDYALKMVAVTVLYPTFLKSTTLITRFIDLENTSLFLIVVIGGACLGFSNGLIKKSGFNPGGFTVIYDILKEYFHISFGTASLIVNGLMIMASGFMFGLNSAIYAIIALLVSSYVVDRVIIGISNNKVFYIITDIPLAIKEYIINNLNYSVTFVNARGGYSNKRKKMLMCVVPTIEYLKLKELVNKIDPKAFFLIVDTYESSVKKNCKNM